ncbi:hypothetical protein MBLNU230_g4838t1 [Neophaeotheca triangularis]
MGTLTADLPRLDHYCEHKLPTSCRLTSIPECCACADERAHSASYSTYIDGIGFVLRGLRWERYCWFCKEFWQRRVEISGFQPAQTRIPEVPDQTTFLERWYEFHRGYRVVRREDGSEERVAVLGEPFREVDPGELPRTLEELREGRERSSIDERITGPVVQEEDTGPGLEEALESMFEDAEQEERLESQREREQRPTLPEPLNISSTNVAGQAIVPAGSRNRDYQARRVAALRRELHRMRNGIERVISGLREFGEDVPGHAETTGRLTYLGRTLDTISGVPSQDDATRAIENANALTANPSTSQADRTLADLQVRVDAARQHADEAQRNRDQAASELDLAEQERRTSRHQLQQLQREQRTAENYMRLFGSREDMAAAGDAYESPIGGMFSRAEERYRTAEEVRREQRTLRQVLDDETTAGGEMEQARLTELEGRERDVWGVPAARSRQGARSRWARRAPDAARGVEQLIFHEIGADDGDADEATLEEYYAMLRRQDWTQRPAEQGSENRNGIPTEVNFPRSMLSEPVPAFTNYRQPPEGRTAGRRVFSRSDHDFVASRLFSARRPPREMSRSHWWRCPAGSNPMTDLYVSEWDVPSGENETLHGFYDLLEREGYKQADSFDLLADSADLALEVVFPQYPVVQPGELQIRAPTKRNFYAEAKALLDVLHRDGEIDAFCGLQEGEKERCSALVQEGKVDVLAKDEIETLYKAAEVVWGARIPTMRLSRLQSHEQLLEIAGHDKPVDLGPEADRDWWDYGGWWKFQLETEFVAQAWAPFDGSRRDGSRRFLARCLDLLLPEEREQMNGRMLINQRDEDDVTVLSQLVCDPEAVSVANEITRRRRMGDNLSDTMNASTPSILADVDHRNDEWPSDEWTSDIRQALGALLQDEDLRTGNDGDRSQLREIQERIKQIDQGLERSEDEELDLLWACDDEVLFRANLPQTWLARLKKEHGQLLVEDRETEEWTMSNCRSEDWLKLLNIEIMAEAYMLSEAVRLHAFCSDQRLNTSTAHQKQREMLQRLLAGQRESSDREELWKLVCQPNAVREANHDLRRHGKDEGLMVPRERRRQIKLLSKRQEPSDEPSEYYGLLADPYYDASIVVDELLHSEELCTKYGWTQRTVDMASRALTIPETELSRSHVAAIESMLATEEALWDFGIPTVMMLKLRRMDKDVDIRAPPASELESQSLEERRAMMWRRITSLELLAQAYTMSSHVRRSCNIAMEWQAPLLFRLRAGERTREDRGLLFECLQKPIAVEAANKVMEHRYGTREAIGRDREYMFQSYYHRATVNASIDETVGSTEWYPSAHEVLRSLRDSPDLRTRYRWDFEDVSQAELLITPGSATNYRAIKERIQNLMLDDDFLWTTRLPESVITRLLTKPDFDLHIETFDEGTLRFPYESLGEGERPKYGIPWMTVQIELMAQAFLRSGEIRRLASDENGPIPDSLPLLYRLQTGQRGGRIASDVSILRRMLRRCDIVQKANEVIRGQMTSTQGLGSAEEQTLRQEASARARQGDHSRSGLNEQRRTISAAMNAASRAALPTSTRSLFDRLANRDDATRGAVRQLEANGLIAALSNVNDVIEVSDGGTMSESEEEESDEEEEDLGLDAPNTGRPEPKTDEQMTVKLECRICYSQTASMACLPCGHLVMCEWCSDHHSPSSLRDRTRPMDQNASCPVCRKKIRQKFKVFTATT